MTTATQVQLAPVIVNPAEGATVKNKVTVSGTAEPGAVVTIAKAGDHNHLFLKLITSQNGHWSGTFGEDLPKGAHEIQAHQTLNGVVSPLSPVRAFKVE
ncbi:hypothetical protein [Pseudomonas brassicacearum]|uniref:Uncharacterized protein n=1 Tax=Pseudomonas brassicacearum TaxID=930166 RepID=A0A423GM31_9PSED|nr:hypothetical protein [Pseudomonas brassicacearum]ROM92496.1 hypothetical protein BK658_21395 [Pseudomonas brassicacearum]